MERLKSNFRSARQAVDGGDRGGGGGGQRRRAKRAKLDDRLILSRVFSCPYGAGGGLDQCSGRMETGAVGWAGMRSTQAGTLAKKLDTQGREPGACEFNRQPRGMGGLNKHCIWHRLKLEAGGPIFPS